MAEEWIKVRHGLPTAREVVVVAAATGRSRYEVLGLLVGLWLYVDRESRNGHVTGIRLEQLPDVVGGDRRIWEELVAVGWLEDSRGGITIPRWERHNSGSRKMREDASLRKRRERRRRDVTPMSRDKAVTVTPMSRECHADVTLQMGDDEMMGDGEKDADLAISSMEEEQTAYQNLFLATVKKLVREARAAEGREASAADLLNATASAISLRRKGGREKTFGRLRARLRSGRWAEYATEDENEARRILREDEGVPC